MQHRAITDADPRRAKVLHIVQYLRGGGAETFVRELIPCLMQEGVDARALCAYGSSRLTDAEARAWNGAVYCQERSGVPRFQYLRQMRRLIRQIAPDIVHTHTHVGAFWGRLAASLEGVRIIVHTEHRSVESLPLLELAAHRILNRKTNAIVTFSDRTAEIVRRREHVRDLSVIPNGVRLRPPRTEMERTHARNNLEVDKDCVLVGLIANLHPNKNLQLALDAFARLPKWQPDRVRLAFFGEGELEAVLATRAKVLGIEHLVRFYGFRNNLQELLPGLDLVLSTSAREMMPMALLESMNAALPIIGTPHAGTLDLVIDGETGIVVKSWDAEAFATAILWAIEHPEWRVRAGNAAYARVKEHFDVRIVARQYVELYHRLLRWPKMSTS